MLGSQEIVFIDTPEAEEVILHPLADPVYWRISTPHSASHMMTSFDTDAPTLPPPGPYTLRKLHPRPLLPFQTPPPCLYPPTLPSPPRKSPLDQHYTLSTHILPGAYPRTTPVLPVPELPKWSPDKGAFRAAARRTAEEVFTIKTQQWNGEFDALPRDARQWWVVVDRYVRKGLRAGERGGVTLFCAHANGFNKEVRVRQPASMTAAALRCFSRADR